MLPRVTHQTIMFNAQRNLQAGAAHLADLQDKAQNLTKISKPSDDPIGVGDSLQIRAQQRAAEQYGRNIDNGEGWLNMADSALSTSNSLLARVRDLTIQGANDGAMSAQAKEAIALELDGLKKDLLSQANTKYLGRNIFAGSSDAQQAFTPDGAYQGTSGSEVLRRIGPDSTVKVDTDGNSVFGSGSTSVFATIDRIAADLRSGVNVGARVNDIDSHTKAFIAGQADIGSRHSQIERAQEGNALLKTTLEGQRAGVEDADLGQAILDLKQQDVSYQAALAITAKVLPQTLMDYMR
jgi:flagellar hook-associated protein 3 FlgL